MSKKPRDLTKIFGKFSGQPLKDPDRMATDMDGVLVAMEKAAKKNGLELRVIFPGKNADFGHNPKRATIFATQDDKGKFHVGNKFTIG